MSSTESLAQAEYVKAQLSRVKNLELLYLKDGRHRLDHPYHSLFTGLYAQSQTQSPTSC